MAIGIAGQGWWAAGTEHISIDNMPYVAGISPTGSRSPSQRSRDSQNRRSLAPFEGGEADDPRRVRGEDARKARCTRMNASAFSLLPEFARE